MTHSHGKTEIKLGIERRLAAIAIVGAIVVVTGLAVLWPREQVTLDRITFGFAEKVFPGEVIRVLDGTCDKSTSEAKCLRVELKEGPDRGKVIGLDMFESPTTPTLKLHDKIVLAYSPEAEPGFEYSFSDRQRRPVLWAVGALFAVAVVAMGGLRGFAALAGLGASIIVIVKFILPAILAGESPVLVACFGAAAIAYVALYLAHGFGPMTTVALIGALTSLAVTAALSAVFVAAAQFSGVASEEASFIAIAADNVNPAGLLLAGIVIASLGALDDMTVTQASAVWELHGADPTMGPKKLFRSAMKIGRDHVASTVNTLALAYAGASLPVMLLFVLSGQSLGTVANSEVIAVEIVGALVGSVGLVVSVPITTFVAVRVVMMRQPVAASEIPS